jgi:hypothetical protein
MELRQVQRLETLLEWFGRELFAGSPGELEITGVEEHLPPNL